jgi:hypothetical protein
VILDHQEPGTARKVLGISARSSSSSTISLELQQQSHQGPRASDSAVGAAWNRLQPLLQPLPLVTLVFMAVEVCLSGCYLVSGTHCNNVLQGEHRETPTAHLLLRLTLHLPAPAWWLLSIHTAQRNVNNNCDQLIHVA